MSEKRKQRLKSVPGRRVEIDFLFINLTSCTRCLGTDANLTVALSELSPILDRTGIEVKLRKILVESERQAERLGLLISPTLRINGKEMVAEHRESRCESCEACSSGGPVGCRLWVYQGREYPEAPVGLIEEAILRTVFGGVVGRKAARHRRMSASLRRFFLGKTTEGRSKKSSCC